MINKIIKIIFLPIIALVLFVNFGTINRNKDTRYNYNHTSYLNLKKNNVKPDNNDDIYSDIAFEEFIAWERKNKSGVLVELYKIVDPLNLSKYNTNYALKLNDNYSKDFISKMISYNRSNQSINLNISLRNWKSLDLKMLSFIKLMTNIGNISFNFIGSSGSSDMSYVMTDKLSISWLSSLKKLRYIKFTSNKFNSKFPYEEVPAILNSNKHLDYFDISDLNLKNDDEFDISKYFSDTNINFSLYLPITFNAIFDQENWDIKKSISEHIYIKKIKKPIPLPSDDKEQILIDGNKISTRIYNSSFLWDISIEELSNVKFFNNMHGGYFTKIPIGTKDKSEYIGVSKIIIPNKYKENYKKLITSSFIIPKNIFEKEITPSLSIKEIENIITNNIYIDGKNYVMKISESKFVYDYDFQSNKIKYYSADMKAFWTSINQITQTSLLKYKIFEADNQNYNIAKFTKKKIPQPTREGQTITIDGKYEAPSVYLIDKNSFTWGYSLEGIDPKNLKIFVQDNNHIFAFTDIKYISNIKKELYPKITSFEVDDDNNFKMETDYKYNILEIFNKDGIREYISSKKKRTINIDDVDYEYRLYDGNLYLDYRDIHKVKYLVYDKNDPDNKEKWKYKTKIIGISLKNNESFKIFKPNRDRQLPGRPLIENPLLSSSEDASIIVDNNVVLPEISENNIYWDFSKVGICPKNIKYKDSRNRYYTKELFDFNVKEIPDGLTSIDNSRLIYIENPKLKLSKNLASHVTFKNIVAVMNNKTILVDGVQYILQILNGKIYWINKSNNNEMLPMNKIKYIVYDDQKDRDSGMYFTSINNAFKYQENFPIGLSKIQKIEYDLNNFTGNGKKINKPKKENETLNIINNNGEIVKIKSISSVKSNGETIIEWDSAFKKLIENLKYVMETPEGNKYYFTMLNIPLDKMRKLSDIWMKKLDQNEEIKISNVANYKLEDALAKYGDIQIRKYDIHEDDKNVIIFTSIILGLAIIFLTTIIAIFIKRGGRWK